MPLGKRSRGGGRSRTKRSRTGLSRGMLSSYSKKKWRSSRYAGPSRNVHSFKRAAAGSTVTFNLPETGGALSFALSNITANTEFANLYDQFKLTRVVVKFMLISNPDATNYFAPGTNTGAVMSTNFFPRLWYYRDYDDASTPTLTDIRQVGKAKCFFLKPNKEYKIAVRPAKLNQLFRGVATTAYAPDWKSRLDMGNQDTPHYGLKYVVDNHGVTSTTSFQMRINYDYYFTCYNTR